MMDRAEFIVKMFEAYNIQTSVLNIHDGITSTIYEIHKPIGVLVSRFTRLSKDVAIDLGVKSVRVYATDSGVSIEVPKEKRDLVSFDDIINSCEFINSKATLPFAVGKDTYGNVIVDDLASMPHIFISGSSGSGKTISINTLLCGVMSKTTPDELKILCVDPKMVELSGYNGLPHMICDAITDAEQAVYALEWLVDIMNERYALMSEYNARNIEEYNAIAETKLCRILLVVDEVGDLMLQKTKAETERLLCILGQKSRACGITMVLATQRPSAAILTKDVSANFPSRLCFSVNTASNSKIALDVTGAEKLIGKGDALYFPQYLNEPLRVQGAYISDEDIKSLVTELKKKPANNTLQFDITKYKKKFRHTDDWAKTVSSIWAEARRIAYGEVTP